MMKIEVLAAEPEIRRVAFERSAVFRKRSIHACVCFFSAEYYLRDFDVRAFAAFRAGIVDLDKAPAQKLHFYKMDARVLCRGADGPYRVEARSVFRRRVCDDYRDVGIFFRAYYLRADRAAPAVKAEADDDRLFRLYAGFRRDERRRCGREQTVNVFSDACADAGICPGLVTRVRGERDACGQGRDCLFRLFRRLR